MKSETGRLIPTLEPITLAFLFLFVLVQPISIAAAEVAYTGAVLSWLLRIVLVRRGILKRSPLDVPVLVYWLLCAVSASLSPLPASSWEGMRKISFVFLVLLVAHNVLNIRRAKQLIVALFLSGLASVACASWQYAAGIGLRIHSPLPDTRFSRSGIRDNDVILRVDGRLMRRPEQFLAYLNSKPLSEPITLHVVHEVHGSGIAILKDAVVVTIPTRDRQNPSAFDNLGMRIEKAHPDRARAFYSHYVTYSILLVLLASLAFGLWLSSPIRSSEALSYAGLFLVFTLALGATLTRAAWLALALGCALQLWCHIQRWSIRVLLPLVSLLAIGATNIAMHRLRGVGVFDLHDPGTDYRLLMWRDGLNLIKRHPWFGVGMNTIRDSWWKFDLAAYRKYGFHWHFHSTPIQIAVEMGIPALLSWIALVGCYFVLLIKLVSRARSQRSRFIYGLALGILGGMAGFVVISLAQYDFGDSAVVLLFWFLAGLAVAMHQQLETNNPFLTRSPA